MTDEQKEECHLVIHAASVSSAGVGAGLAQTLLADSAVFVPIQITNDCCALGKVFDVHITDSAAKGIALGMVGMYVGRSVSQVLLGWIPVLGNVINADTAGAITEAMGWAVASKFEKGDITGKAA